VPEVELVPTPRAGRVYTDRACAGLADVAPSGRVRLDAIARWLQDAAYADVLDSGLRDDGVWVVRRMRLRVERFPRLREPIAVATWCSGTVSLWAERRTTARGDGGGLVEAVAVWIHLDADRGRPRPMPEGFDALYGAAAGGRRVRARLNHPPAPPAAEVTPWRFRAADLDLAGHVNNAVYWQALEEDLAGASDPPEPFDAEIEHRAAADAGEAAVARADAMVWVTTTDGEVLASLGRVEQPTG
jgi:acyl-ACP thioesterase